MDFFLVEMHGKSITSQTAFKPRILLDMALHACNHSDWAAKARGSREQGHPWLYTKFEVTLGYVRACLKQGERALIFPVSTQLRMS